MTYYEYRDIKKLQENLILKHQQKLYLYYGKKDDWVPLHFYEEIKKKFPQLDANLD